MKALVKAKAESGKITMADGFFGVQKRIIVLDMDADLVSALQPLPDYAMDVPDQCYSENLQGEEKARVGRLEPVLNSVFEA